MRHIVDKVWIDDEKVYARTSDGLVASYSFDLWPRLKAATEAQRKDFRLSYLGITWPQIDEDLSFEGMFSAAGLCPRTENEDSVCWLG